MGRKAIAEVEKRVRSMDVRFLRWDMDIVSDSIQVAEVEIHMNREDTHWFVEMDMFHNVDAQDLSCSN